jgi:hypothetical protein
MKTNQQESHRCRVRFLALAAGVIGCLAAGQAAAGCGYSVANVKPPMGWSVEAPAQATENTMSLAADASRADEGNMHLDSIVGTWKVTLVSDGTAYPAPIPAGVTLDFGTSQWHSDGTEFLISGARPPSTGDVCMGSWTKTGRNVYTLRHIALAWVSSDSTPPAATAMFLGPSLFHQVVTVSRSGRSYEGSLSIDQYAADGTTLLEHIGAKVMATRF